MCVAYKLVFLVLMVGSQVHTGRIFGGHVAVPHSRPYMVLLECEHPNGNHKHCDGSLLNEDFVMTAAHCYCKTGRLFALLGVDNYHNNTKQRIFVSSSFPHENYAHDSIVRNDIMLLKLSSKANFTQHVRPIALAETDLNLPQNCLVSGWGRFDDTGFQSDVLREVNVTILDRGFCTPNNVYCSEGEAGPGQGDSGGPLVCEDGRAHGLVSFSLNTIDTKINAYTLISHFTDWIHGIMNDPITVNVTKST